MTNESSLQDALTKEEVALVWQLLNTQGTGTTFAGAHIAAGLYAKVKEAAEKYGLLAT